MRGSQTAITLGLLAAQFVVTASAFRSVVFIGQEDFRTGGRCRSIITGSCPLQMSFFGFFKDPERRSPRTVDDSDIFSLEKEVLSSVQAQVDRANAKRALVSALSDDSELSRTTTPPWAAAIAAAAIAGSISFFTFQNALLGAIVAMSVGFVASRNPVEEEDAVGSIARTVSNFLLDCGHMNEWKLATTSELLILIGMHYFQVGRYTIASVEAATKLLQRGMRLTAMIQDGECQLMSDETNVAFRPTLRMQPA